MQVIADGITYDYDGAKLSVLEAIAIEEHTGLSLGDYREKMQDLAGILRDNHDPIGLRCLQALIGVARHRAGEDTLGAFGHVDFDLATLNFVPTKTEVDAATKDKTDTATPPARRRRQGPPNAQ